MILYTFLKKNRKISLMGNVLNRCPCVNEVEKHCVHTIHVSTVSFKAIYVLRIVQILELCMFFMTWLIDR